MNSLKLLALLNLLMVSKILSKELLGELACNPVKWDK